jgi:hypothetical protein
MSLTNLDKESLYMMLTRVKNQASRGQVPNFDEIVIICNELLGLVDQLHDFEKALKLSQLFKDIHNHVHNF